MAFVEVDSQILEIKDDLVKIETQPRRIRDNEVIDPDALKAELDLLNNEIDRLDIIDDDLLLLEWARGSGGYIISADGQTLERSKVRKTEIENILQELTDLGLI